MHFSLEELIRTAGLLGMFGIVFAESGLFFGFFLPGDSLLFTAGFLASQGVFPIVPLVILMVVAAISGDSVGYWTGRRLGKWLLNRKDSFFFKRRHIDKAQAFYNKHGGKTIFLARFVPFVRTFAPIVAGMAQMHYNTFLSFNVFGGLCWAAGITLAGYFLGKSIPDVDKYLFPIIVVIVIVSIAPGILHLLKERKSDAKATKEV